MDKIDEVRKCVEKWVEIRPVLDGWLKYVSSYTSEWQSIVIRVRVPTRFDNTKGERLYFYQQYQIPLEVLERVGVDLPNYVSSIMFKLVNEVTTSTMQPKIEDIYLMPIPSFLQPRRNIVKFMEI